MLNTLSILACFDSQVGLCPVSMVKYCRTHPSQIYNNELGGWAEKFHACPPSHQLQSSVHKQIEQLYKREPSHISYFVRFILVLLNSWPLYYLHESNFRYREKCAGPLVSVSMTLRSEIL